MRLAGPQDNVDKPATYRRYRRFAAGTALGTLPLLIIIAVAIELPTQVAVCLELVTQQFGQTKTYRISRQREARRRGAARCL